MGVNGDYRVFFSKDDPQLLAFDRIQNVYAKDDGILIVLAPRDSAVSAVGAAGWLGYFFTPPSARHLGNISAMGIVAAFVYTVTFLPRS